MTDGHRHHILKVKEGGLIERGLRSITVHRSNDVDQVDASRFVYTDDPSDRADYRMSLLGFLHPLTGLTLEVPDQQAQEDEPESRPRLDGVRQPRSGRWARSAPPRRKRDGGNFKGVKKER